MIHQDNSPVKFDSNWLNGVCVVIIFFLLLALAAIMLMGAEQFYLFW